MSFWRKLYISNLGIFISKSKLGVQMIFDDLDLVKFDDVLLVLVSWPIHTPREKGKMSFLS